MDDEKVRRNLPAGALSNDDSRLQTGAVQARVEVVVIHTTIKATRYAMNTVVELAKEN